MFRGNNGDPLFTRDRDYRRFVELYAKHCGPVLAIDLLNMLGNHVHGMAEVRTHRLDLTTGQRLEPLTPKSVNQSIANFLNAYAKYFNSSHHHSGSVFETGFGRRLVDSEAYLRNLALYIANNALHHGFVNEVGQWSYCSHVFLGAEKTPWHDPTRLFDLFGGQANFLRELQRKGSREALLEFELDDKPDPTDVSRLLLVHLGETLDLRAWGPLR
jgi:hypothetical protein